MKLPRELEIAIALLPKLAEHETHVRVRELVKGLGIKADQAGRVLGKLVRAGLILAVRGRKGGYRLDAKMVDLYTLMDLIHAVGGGVYTRPEPASESCARVRGRLAGAIRRTASKMTFRMIVEGKDNGRHL